MPQATYSKSKNVLAVRMLVARTDWLDGHLYWRDGSISWETTERPFFPDAADLSRTQRCLNKIARYPNAARAALSDSPLWLARRRERLELAKHLRELSGADVTGLAREAHHREPSVVAGLCRLLVAEALCLNTLPVAPSAALVALGQAANASILSLLQNEETPPAARALAALILGAISRMTHTWEHKRSALLSAPWQARSFAWGSRHGLTAHPTLVTALLASDEDAAGRGLRAVEAGGDLSLSVGMLRELLAEGLPPPSVVTLAEAACEAETVAERLLNVRRELPDLHWQREERRRWLDELRAERRQAIRELAGAIEVYARSTGEPVVLRLMTAFLHRMLDLTGGMTASRDATAAVLEQALEVIRMGLKLPPDLRRDYWELLVERHQILWDVATLPLDPRPAREIRMFRGWLHEAQARNVSPLRTLLAVAKDRATVVSAFDLGIQQIIAGQSWQDPDLYRLFVTLAVSLGLKGGDYFLWSLSRVLDAFPNARDARPYFQALLQPLQAAPTDIRRHVLEELLQETGDTRQAIHQRLPRVLPLLPALAQYAEEARESWAFGPVCAAALAISSAVPEQAQARMKSLLASLRRPEQGDWTYEQILSLGTGLTLAVSLTADDAARFQDAVRTAVGHKFRQDQDQVKDGLSRLCHLPHLRDALAHLFPAQPQRMADLLVRLGLTSRLGTDVQPLLARLEPLTDPGEGRDVSFPVLLHPDAAWWDLHRRMPDLTPTANAYLHAQWLSGGPRDMPAGMRRALNRTDRTATELAHLEGVLASAPERTDLAARAAKLRTLLDDGPRLEAEVRAEVRERLRHVAAQAQADAAERQVRACYQARLEVVAGPLAPDLVLTDDLINAALLTVDIAQNRKLLLMLLRAHLSGDEGWRERHPANKSFLETLMKRGVDAGTWLSEFPRRYPVGRIPGGRVHLRLERDPLHVLQMGNHFDTCLSFGGVNAFSTVANACELNKRVIYARDASGHIIGRKLIGINEEGEMIGFHTYCSLTEEKDNEALRDIFRRYAGSFADLCRLRLGNKGTVPTLLAEAWYDDGIVSWDDQEESRKLSLQVVKVPNGLRFQKANETYT